MNTTNNTKKTYQLNSIAGFVYKPQRPMMFTHTPEFAYLTKNRKGIAKLRQRGFSWSQIVQVLDNNNINVSYTNIYQWQTKTFQQRKKTTNSF